MKVSMDKVKAYSAVLVLLFCICAGGCAKKESGPDPSVPAGGSAAEGPAEENAPAQASGEQEGAGNISGDGESGRADGSGSEMEKDGTANTGGEHDPKAEKSAAMIPEKYHVGDVLEDGDLRIVYASSGLYEEEEEALSPDPGTQYVRLRFCFENTSEKEGFPISLFGFSCYADQYAAKAYYGGIGDPPASVPAGRSAFGTLYFQVPVGAEEIEVEYAPRYISSDLLPPSERVSFVYEGTKDSGYTPAPRTERTEGAIAAGGSASAAEKRITYISCAPDDSDNEYIQPAEGCHFQTMTFEFENLTAEELTVSAYDFSCYADGLCCRSVFFRDDYLSDTISAGKKARGTVTFEVPDAAQTVEAEYDAEVYGATGAVFTLR